MVRLKSYHFGFCIYMACHQECVEMRLCDKARDCVCGWESGCQKSGCQKRGSHGWVHIKFVLFEESKFMKEF